MTDSTSNLSSRDASGGSKAVVVARAASASMTWAAASSNAVSDLQAAVLSGGPDGMPFYALHYLREKAVGRSPNTVDARARDLSAFVRWFHGVHGAVAMRAWNTADTHAYLAQLRGEGRSPATFNRSLQSLRNFARWAQAKYVVFGTGGLPTDDVRELVEGELPCKKLSADEVRRLFAAGEAMVAECDAARAAAERGGERDPTRRLRPRRDLAMLAMLYFTGLRAQELVSLKREQFDGEAFTRVVRKGNNESRRIFVPPRGRAYLADYLHSERGQDEDSADAVALFLTSRRGGHLARQDLAQALRRIGERAGVKLHPHMLRHTFGARYRAASGSDTETAAALAHRSLKYVGRYTRATDDERDAMAAKACDF